MRHAEIKTSVFKNLEQLWKGLKRILIILVAFAMEPWQPHPPPPPPSVENNEFLYPVFLTSLK